MDLKLKKKSNIIKKLIKYIKRLIKTLEDNTEALNKLTNKFNMRYAISFPKDKILNHINEDNLNKEDL